MAVAEELKVVIRAEVANAQRDMQKFNRSLDKTKGRAIDAGGAMKAMGANLVKMVAAGAGIVALVALLKKVTAASLAAAASFEVQQVEFGVFLQDIEKGNQLFRQLQRFSAETPLALENITTAAKQLISFGTDVADVQYQIKLLGDAALGNSQKLETLTRAFGRVQARGRASMEEVNMAMEAGLPIIDELAKQMGVTKAAVFDLISQGKVGFAEWQSAFENMTGEAGRFNNGMAKLAETFTGKLSTLKDNLKLLGAAMQEDLLPKFKEAFDFATRIIQNITLLVENDMLGRALRIIGEGLWDVVRSIFKPENFQEITQEIGRQFVAILGANIQTFVGFLGHGMDILKGTADLLGEDWIKELMNGIIRGATAGPRWVLGLLGVEGARDWKPFETSGPSIGESLYQSLTEQLPEVLDTWLGFYRQLGASAVIVGNAFGDAVNPALENTQQRLQELLDSLRVAQEELSSGAAPLGGGAGATGGGGSVGCAG